MSYGGQTHNTQYLPSNFLFDRSDTHGYTTRQSFLHFASIPLKTRYRVGRRREVSDNKMYANFKIREPLQDAPFERHSPPVTQAAPQEEAVNDDWTEA